MRIVKIGTWDANGKPVGWEIDRTNDTPYAIPTVILTLTVDGRVEVDRVEVVEWTQARRKAMEKA